jgi:hypothetical protein
MMSSFHTGRAGNKSSVCNKKTGEDTPFTRDKRPIQNTARGATYAFDWIANAELPSRSPIAQ